MGDLVVSAPVYDRLMRTSPALVKWLQSADVTFGNFESSVLDLPNFDGYPAALSGGAWLLSSPGVPADLRRMGFNLLSRANNHATDFGVKGMLSTDKSLDQAGLVHAGSGRTLSEARAARILPIGAGRIALVAMTSRFEADSPAADPNGQFAGRPGISALHTTRYTMVSAEQLATLATMRDALPAEFAPPSLVASDRKNGSVTIFDAHYKARNGPEAAFSFAVSEDDRRSFVGAIRQGKQTSEFLVGSLHTHEPGNYSDESPEFIPALAHEAIDNGADAFIVHGPHWLRGIEIYKGKPIFYSLGNFFFMVDTVQPLTTEERELQNGLDNSASQARSDLTDAEFTAATDGFKDSVWFESVVAVSHFDEKGRVRKIELHPVELNWQASRNADRGIPRLAPPDVAQGILDRLQILSKPYGTKIEAVDGVGLVRPASP